MFLNYGETVREIESGKLLHIAGAEEIMDKLPKGNWVGGTTPYFITEEGGVRSHEKCFVEVLEGHTAYQTAVYDAESILSVTKDVYANGYTLLLLPYASEVLKVYGEKAPEIENIFMSNILGWVTGTDLDVPTESPKVYNGMTGESYSDAAIALHLELPADKLASVGIVNIFEPNQNLPKIKVPTAGFTITDCIIDGETVNFAAYIRENQIDTRLPLVANYSGSNVNVSIKEVGENSVSLYAPVFTSIGYRFAVEVPNYEAAFKAGLEQYASMKPLFSCNCILNYLYGALEGKGTPPFAGPVTFGEIAYQLVNQTLVFLAVQ